MRALTHQELELCRLQGELFEQSPALADCSSPVFVRRFMNSQTARRFDAGSVLFESTTSKSLAQELEQEYGPCDYGKVRYGGEVLYWMGYLYRYWCCVTGMSSKRVFKIAPGRELSELYGPYHSLDPVQAIVRIYEAKGLSLPRALATASPDSPDSPDQDDGHVAEGVDLLRRMHATGSYEYFVIRF